MLKHKKWLIVLVSAILLVIAGAYIFYVNLIEADKSFSPDKNYQVSINKLTNRETVIYLPDGSKCYTVFDNTHLTYLWSPDSRYLVHTYIASDGLKLSYLTDHKSNMGLAIPNKSSIQNAYKKTLTTVNDNNTGNLYIAEWLDKQHALVKFSWPSDAEGEVISGWYTFDIPNYSIEDLHIVDSN